MKSEKIRLQDIEKRLKRLEWEWDQWLKGWEKAMDDWEGSRKGANTRCKS